MRGLSTHDYRRLAEMIAKEQMRCDMTPKGIGAHRSLAAMAERLNESWNDRAIIELEVAGGKSAA